MWCHQYFKEEPSIFDVFYVSKWLGEYRIQERRCGRCDGCMEHYRWLRDTDKKVPGLRGPFIARFYNKDVRFLYTTKCLWSKYRPHLIDKYPIEYVMFHKSTDSVRYINGVYRNYPDRNMWFLKLWKSLFGVNG
jgi:hypothetical protein